MQAYNNGQTELFPALIPGLYNISNSGYIVSSTVPLFPICKIQDFKTTK